MRIVWSWLRELVALENQLTPRDAAEALTAAGLEVEAIEDVGRDFSGVVVAQVVGKRKHPDADRLTLVDVIDQPDGEKFEVVCGANNVPDPGGLVLWARPGARLPGDAERGPFEIATRKLKGVTSHGMICSEDELGLGDDHSGIIVLSDSDVPHGALGDLLGLGEDAALERLGVRDTVLEIGTYANRPDTLGHVGIARELAALLGVATTTSPFDPAEIPADLLDDGLDAASLVTVAIDDPQGCPRYTARVIDGVTIAPSPRWMQQRLRAMGARPISNQVDVTNYVMFHHGNPLHAFDHGKVADGHIAVRRARAGERLTTLDDVERVLEPGDLVICDGKGPVALAGVMGGKDSEVSEGTGRILLETANFEPKGVRRTARRLKLHSEASHRFERGVDANVALAASRMAATLLARLGGGRVARGVVDAYVRRAEPCKVSLRASRASLLTGIELDRDRCGELLGRLDIAIEKDSENPDVLHATCPTFRGDLTREVDLIEEVIRLHGVHKVPGTLPSPSSSRTLGAPRTVDQRPHLTRRALMASGLSESITYGYTSSERVAAMRFESDDRRARPVPLQNPMTIEQAVMRTTLLPNLLGQVAHNLSFGITDIALFEVGSVFLATEPGQLPDEPRHVAAVMTGCRPGWLRDGGALDFFDSKGVVERLVSELLGPRASRVRYNADSAVPFMHPGACAEVRMVADDSDSMAGDRIAGHVGEIHPATREAFGIDQPCFGFELTLDGFPAPGPVAMVPVPRHPAITRDISIFVDQTITAGHLRSLIASAASSVPDDISVERIAVLEDYRDPEKVPEGMKGMLWTITYRADQRNLTDAEVNQAHESIESGLLADLPGAERR